MAYPKTDPRADFTALEHQVLEFWRSDDTFHKSLNQTKLGHPFSFYDGPPFANGLPHWGHLGVSAVKDMISRYQTMRGRHVVRELGWDCHGLPAESSVEKKQKQCYNKHANKVIFRLRLKFHMCLLKRCEASRFAACTYVIITAKEV